MRRTTLTTTVLFFCLKIFAAPVTDLDIALKRMKAATKHGYNIEKGISSCQEVLQLAEKYSETYFEAIFQIGLWQVDNRDKSAAEATLDKMEKELNAAQTRKTKTYWAYWNFLKSYYHSKITMNYEKALINGTKALFDSKTNLRLMPIIATELVAIYSIFGQFSLAETFLDIYKKTAKVHYTKDDYDRSRYYLRLGIALRQVENDGASVEALEQALAIIQPQKNEALELYRECLAELVVSYKHNDQRDKSAQITKELLQFDAQYLSYQHHMVTGNLHSTSGDYERALPLLQKALVQVSPIFNSYDIFENPHFDEDFHEYEAIKEILDDKSWSLYKKALVIQETNETEATQLFEKSIETALLGVKIMHRAYEGVVGYELSSIIVNEETHILLGKALYAAISLYQLTGEEKDFNRVFDLIEQRKSMTLLQTWYQPDIPQKITDHIHSFVQVLKNIEQEFQLASLREQIPILNRAHKTSEAFDKYIDSVRLSFPKLRINHDDIQYTSLTTIQNTLDEHTAFIQYSLVDGDIHAILITDDAYAMFSKMTDYYDGEISVFTKTLPSPFLVQKKNRERFIQKSNEFYQNLIEPFEEELAGKRRLILSPERDLLYVPFEVLLKDADVKPLAELDYLINYFEINYQYSATLHQRIKTRPKITNKSLLAFAPVFSEGQNNDISDRSSTIFDEEDFVSIQNNEFAYLPNTKIEVETISSILDHPQLNTTLLESEATKEQLLEQLEKQPYQFIHIATHSMVSYGDPRLSAIACFKNNQEENNLCFAGEIEEKTIQADLVILSSCESGIGRIVEGEGIVGLNRSFIYGGARNVMFSLWKVNDEYSSQLMIDFYKNYTAGQDYTSALHNAKLKMLSNTETSHPRFWAAFVLLGQ